LVGALAAVYLLVGVLYNKHARVSTLALCADKWAGAVERRCLHSFHMAGRSPGDQECAHKHVSPGRACFSVSDMPLTVKCDARYG